MKAWVIERLGGPEVYSILDVPVPEPGADEVQVRVEGAGMNPVDWKIREGMFPPAEPKQFPAVTLREFSGTISKLGPGVTGYRIGDGVYGITDIGAAAEYTVAKTSAIGPRPRSLNPVDAAVVPLAGMTAWQALFDHGHLRAGQRVLIHAASGGVGTFAVQLAKWKGAHVIATASAKNHALLKALGADEMIDYQKERFENKVKDIDLVLHSIGAQEIPASLSVLRKGGRLISIAAPVDEEAASKEGKFAETFMMQPKSDQLRRLADLIDNRELRPIIENIVPLEKAVEAMENVQGGHEAGKNGVRLL